MIQSDQITIGKISKIAGVLPSTIRFYVKQGLLDVAGHTPGGFLLFDLQSTLQRLERIQKLKTQDRLTLIEIRDAFMADINSCSDL